jgi:hypothetical protein
MLNRVVQALASTEPSDHTALKLDSTMRSHNLALCYLTLLQGALHGKVKTVTLSVGLPSSAESSVLRQA